MTSGERCRPRFFHHSHLRRTTGLRTMGVAAVLAALVGALAALQAEPADLTLKVTDRARVLSPGEVVLLRAETSRQVELVEGTSPAGSVRFFQTDNPLVWDALVGLDLDTPKGPFRIVVKSEAGGTRTEQGHVLAVVPKTFSSRKITVAPEFATPPQSALERIKREAERVSTVLKAVSPARLWTEPFARPVPGIVTSAFGHRSIVNGEPRSPHGGVDMRAALGAPVRTPNGGRIVLSDDLYYSGETVIIDHGLGLFSYMGHLSKRNVAEGELVKRGDLIGLAGSTGRSTAPHLHWTVRLGGARVDPMSLLAVMGE